MRYKCKCGWSSTQIRIDDEILDEIVNHSKTC